MSNSIFDKALAMHSQHPKGKVEISISKPIANAEDLSWAYSPGVAAPCLEIAKDSSLSYEYTSKGHTVAVISNGTAVLGLGNIGAAASKPVMEGKSALMKFFADLNSVDIEVETNDVDEFVNIVQKIGNTWGGINLEDIKAPQCFEIEKRLKETMNIPVFHDDQHGTAVIALAGLINALKIKNKNKEDVKIIINGAGAAGLSCKRLFTKYGFDSKNIILCDTKGVIYKGRQEGMNQYKEEQAVETDLRSLADAINGADVAIGLSQKGAFTKEMIQSMAEIPVIFALANPDPEITPEEVMSVNSNAIIATGRSDYPNQINNVLCFPYLFKGALKGRASAITDNMLLAVATKLADLASEGGEDGESFGPQYIVPKPFEKRLKNSLVEVVYNEAIKN